MPNFPNVRKAVQECSHPLMVFLSKGEVASQKTKLRAFTSGDLTVVSNQTRFFSPVDGKEMSAVNTHVTEVAGEQFNDFNDLVTMTCKQCEVAAGVDPDLAFELAGEDMHCPACGKQTRFCYESAGDDSDDEDGDETEMDDVEDLDDADLEDADDDTDDEEDGDSADNFESASFSSLDEVLAVEFTGDEDADSDAMTDIEAFITADSTSPDDRRAALQFLMEAIGEEGEITDEDVADFMSEAESYSGEMASFSANIYARKSEVADDSAFTADDSDKKLFDKHSGKVAVMEEGSDTPLHKGKLLRILTESSVLFETEDGQKMTAKFDSVKDGDGYAALYGTAQVAEQASAEDEPTAMPTAQDSDTTLESNIEVDAISFSDENVNLKLASLTQDNNEIAAFVGGVHVGTLRRDRASEKAASLYSDGHKLYAAFRAAFNANRSTPRSSELSSFGFEPVVFNVHVGDLFKKRLDKEVAQVEAAAKAETASSVSSFGKVIELAFVGINKGLFPGNNDLAREIASLLKRSGVKNADLETRRLLAKNSHNFVKSVLEKATELSEKDENYLKGVAESVGNADFVGNVEAEITDNTPAPVVEKQEREVASADFINNKPSLNRYRDAIRGLGTRHRGF